MIALLFWYGLIFPPEQGGPTVPIALPMTPATRLDIYEAIVRHAADRTSSVPVFLAAHGKDTDPALLTRLRDIQRPLHLRSESNLEGPGPVAGGISLKGTTTRGILLDISTIRCLRADLVIVVVRKDDCTGTGGAYGTCTLHRLEGHWTVVEWKIDRYS